jgi:hypothetical protein
MRVLSIVGIIMSVIGLVTSIYIMTEAKCHCSCENDFLFSVGEVPDDAISGSMITMLVFIFFLVFSILGVSRSHSSKPHLSQPIPPFQANPYPNYQQPYQQQYNPQYPPNPYQQNQNPYQQNPYQNPNPYQKPEQQTPPTTPPPTNPWEPK